MKRRSALAQLAALPLASAAVAARAQGAPAATLSVPGPRNSISLPLELARQLGIDRESGLPLRLSFVGGGGVAIQELRAGNAEFAVFGLPAMVRANLVGGARMVALAALDGLPLYTLVVRADLRGAVRSVRDLSGRTLGVHSNSLQVRTTSHQLADYLLRHHGVDPARVKVLAAGQSWETQSSMLLSRSVDVSMCDEPFATRMEAEGLAFKLFSTGNPADAAAVPGTGFLRGVLVALKDRVDAQPERAERAVRLVQTTLGWIAGQGPEKFVDALGMQGAERASALAVARAYPRQYSRDGRFSARQLTETETFFRASNDDLPELGALRIADMIVDRWAGRTA
jgi:NitT/TauT family transport system substrate-binding protein